MHRLEKLGPSPALIVAMAALVLAMSGAAVALPGKNTVKKNDIANGAVTHKKIAKNAVRSKQVLGKSLKGNDLRDKAVKAKQIADETITGAQVENESLSDQELDDYEVIGDDTFVRLTATEGASEAAARSAAPATELFTKGQLTTSAKCFRDTGADTTFAEIYVGTAADGAIFEGATDELSGGNLAGDFLNTGTDETDRVLDDVSVTGSDAAQEQGVFTASAPDGTHLVGQTTVAVKSGALAAGNGVYGDGNVCLFGGEISG